MSEWLSALPSAAMVRWCMQRHRRRVGCIWSGGVVTGSVSVRPLGVAGGLAPNVTAAKLTPHPRHRRPGAHPRRAVVATLCHLRLPFTHSSTPPVVRWRNALVPAVAPPLALRYEGRPFPLADSEVWPDGCPFHEELCCYLTGRPCTSLSCAWCARTGRAPRDPGGRRQRGEGGARPSQAPTPRSRR